MQAVPLHHSPTERIDRILERGFPWLRFPVDLERQFLRDTVHLRKRQFLISGLVSLLVYNGFLVADYLLVPEAFGLAVLLRLFVFTPLSIIFLVLILRGVFDRFERVMPSLYDLLATAGGLLAAGSLSLMLFSTEMRYVPYYHTGFMVVLVYGNTVQRLRFWWAVFFSTCVLTLHVLTAWLAGGFDPAMLPPIASLILSVTLFTLSANYVMERDERRRHLFLLRERAVVHELSALHQRLRDLARTDPITGLFNRRHIQERLPLAWTHQALHGGHVGLLMINIDHFKRYHDRYGLMASESCLRQVGETIRACVKPSEARVARYGDDTFVVLLPDDAQDTATALAERIRQAVASMGVRHAASAASRYVTVSIGVARWPAHAGTAAEAMLQAAEQAMSEAKAAGRNRVVQATGPVNQVVA